MGLPNIFSTSSSPPSWVRTWSRRAFRELSTISLLTFRESTRACIRKIFATIICSRRSQRTFLSDNIPFARITLISSSIAEILIISSPTTATDLSMRPLPYFCALAPAVPTARAATHRKNAFKFFIFISILHEDTVFACIFHQFVLQCGHQFFLSDTQ